MCTADAQLRFQCRFGHVLNVDVDAGNQIGTILRLDLVGIAQRLPYSTTDLLYQTLAVHTAQFFGESAFQPNAESRPVETDGARSQFAERLGASAFLLDDKPAFVFTQSEERKALHLLQLVVFHSSFQQMIATSRVARLYQFASPGLLRAVVE